MTDVFTKYIQGDMKDINLRNITLSFSVQPFYSAGIRVILF